MKATMSPPRNQRFVYFPRPGRLVDILKARFYPSQVDPAQVSLILDHYALETTRPPENLALGWRNHNLVLYTPAGKLVLKRYREGWSPQTIRHEHSILLHLESRRYPAPRLLRTRHGDTLVAEDGYHFALFEYIPGTNLSNCYMPRAQRDALVAHSGQMLALLHQELTGFQPEGQHHLGYGSFSDERQRDLAWHLNTLEALRSQSADLTDPQSRQIALWLRDRSTQMGESLVQLEALTSTVVLPRQVIHGDYGIHNLLFRRDGSITVHDFELARLEWRLIDLVAVLSRMDERRGSLFMSAYQQDYPLEPEEWDLLPQVWQQYRLRGAIQSWHNFFELGDSKRLLAAQKRVLLADQVPTNRHGLWALKENPGESPAPRTPRVVMVARLFHPWVGGTERQAQKLASKLLEKGVPVEIVTGWWFRGTPRSETIAGVPVHRNFTFWAFLGIKGLRKFGGYLYILTLLGYLWRRRHDYDLIHVHGLNYHTFAAVIAGRWLKKSVVTKLANSAHASDIEKMRQDKQLFLAKTMLPMALKSDRFIALNAAVVQELRSAGVPQEKIISLPNGVETGTISPKTSYTLHSPIQLLFVGRLHPQKGLDILLEAFALLHRNQWAGNHQLQLLGDGPLKDQLVTRASELGIASQVVFAGETRQVDKYLEKADIFVLPSRAEGLSNALLEAMAAALPVVVSDIPGNRDVIDHRVNGLRFKVDDPASLAQNIRDLLDQPGLRERLGRTARSSVEQYYSLDTIASKYTALYQHLLPTNQADRAPVLNAEKGRIQPDEI